VSHLRERVAIVTGATRGIGHAIAAALNSAGAQVVVAARRDRDVQAVAQELTKQGTRAHGVVCDVRKYEDCQRLVSSAIDAFGRIDILINNAGIGTFAPVEQMSVEDWHRTIETNLNSLFYLCHEAMPHLKNARGAWIINIGSLAGKNAFPGGAAYNASKFGVIGFSEALMQEVRKDDIRVSYIMPGSVATEFGGSADHSAWKIQPDDIAELVMDLLRMNPRTLPSRIEVRPSKPPAK
jgi:3-oxoacyl-[acyl-carrier protein] reductase